MSDYPQAQPLQELTLRPDLNVLFGRWLQQPADPAELRPCYQQLADLALASNCRFWLQDLRRRAAPDQQTKEWLLHTYYPGVAQQFGRRLYVAYLFSPAMYRQIMEAPDYAPPQAYTGQPYALDFFGSEGDALQWLQSWQ